MRCLVHTCEPSAGRLPPPLTEGRIRPSRRGLRVHAPAAEEARLVAAHIGLVKLFLVKAPMRRSSSNSSRRCVRIISGPSVAIVNGTPCSMNARKVVADSRLVRERLRQQVRRRADLQHDPRLAERAPSAPGRRAARMPWPIRSGRSASTTSRISSSPWSPPSSPTWIVTPRPAARASSTIGASWRSRSGRRRGEGPRCRCRRCRGAPSGSPSRR